MTFTPDVALHSDEDAFRWLHTDDPDATGWTVRSFAPGSGEGAEVSRESPGPWLPGNGLARPAHAWPVGARGQSWCHLEIRSDDGRLHTIGRCAHVDPPQ